MKCKNLMKKLFAMFVVMALTAVFAVQALAGATPFGSNDAGNKIFAARGFSVTTKVDGVDKELWLDSPFDHAYYDGINNKASIELGSKDDAIEVGELEAGTYTFHTWLDKNPQGGNLSGNDVYQFFAVYIGDATTPTKLIDLKSAPYNVSFGSAKTEFVDPNGLTGQWSIDFKMTLMEGETYRFVFLRGIQAKNTLTLVLYPATTATDAKSGYVGLLNGNDVSAEEKALYDAHKFDVYQFISEKKELGKDSTGKTVYELTQIPLEHSVKIAGDAPAPTHTHTWETVPAVEATCTKTGLTEGVRCSSCGEWQKEQTVVPMKEHTPRDVAAVPATCTTEGKTAGKVCDVCGKVLEGLETVDETPHTEVVVSGTPATCTEDGKTEGRKCSVCGTLLVEQKTITKLGHKFVDGVCERCNEKDPDYKPVSKFTGLADSADANGDWWYYTDGKIDKTHTGVDQNKYGWWRVENGKVNFNAQSIYQNAYGWWKTTDGKVTFKEEGVFQNEYGWWRVEESKVNFKAQSIYQNQYGWWKTTDGKVTFKENGLFKNQYGTWKVENSKVNFNYNGTYQGKTIKNGKVQ